MVKRWLGGDIDFGGALRQSREPGSFAWLARVRRFSRKYGENARVFFSFLNGQKRSDISKDTGARRLFRSCVYSQLFL